MNENLKVVCVINGEYVDKKGKTRLSKNYYLIFNNHYIAIKPSFESGYRALELICSEYRDNRKKEEVK